MARGLIIAAPHSGSGKTLITLGLCRALAQSGAGIAPAKTGPDYIDPTFLAAAARNPCVNLDPWGMSERRLLSLAGHHAEHAGWLVIEGVMGLFDGAIGGGGSTADLATILGLPVVLVIDCARMAQSVAAMADGFVRFRSDVEIGGVLLNNVASPKHEAMLRSALDERNIRCLGAIERDKGLHVPGRHLGLVMPGEVEDMEMIIERAASAVGDGIDMVALEAIAGTVPSPQRASHLPPLGQRIAIAYDAAFCFLYTHWYEDWHRAGAEISFFSPLSDQVPDTSADAVFLPGGYPELHGGVIAGATRFREGLAAARDRGALIYGECGGYMALGAMLTDAQGVTHPMTGLLPHATRIDKPRRALGYRYLRHQGMLPFPRVLAGHEFHYSEDEGTGGEPLFQVSDARGSKLKSLGTALGRVCGSYAHVIDGAEARA